MAYDLSQKLDEQSKKLRQIAASTGLSVGSGGFKYHGAAAATGVKYTALVPQEDTVFTVFKVDGVDVLADRGMTGITFNVHLSKLLQALHRLFSHHLEPSLCYHDRIIHYQPLHNQRPRTV